MLCIKTERNSLWVTNYCKRSDHGEILMIKKTHPTSNIQRVTISSKTTNQSALLV